MSELVRFRGKIYFTKCILCNLMMSEVWSRSWSWIFVKVLKLQFILGLWFGWYFKSGSLVKNLKLIFFINFGHGLKEVTLVTALNLWALGNVYLKWQGILVWVIIRGKGLLSSIIFHKVSRYKAWVLVCLLCRVWKNRPSLLPTEQFCSSRGALFLLRPHQGGKYYKSWLKQWFRLE